MGFLIRIFKFALKLGVVVVGIGVIVSYARLSEHGDLRAELMQRIADSYVGRLSIGGPTELQFTFPPSVIIHDVRIKNAKWASKPDMMRANTVVAEIDLIPLLQGQMAMPRLHMIGVDIVVEAGPNGKTNWDELNDFETAGGACSIRTAIHDRAQHRGDHGILVAGNGVGDRAGRADCGLGVVGERGRAFWRIYPLPIGKSGT